MKIDTFGVETWMNEWETKCELNLAETCVESLSIEELLLMAGKNETDLSALLPLKMTYGEIKGSDRLRNAIAALYNKQSSVNVVVTHGTIGANMLVHKTLVEHGDHVISIVPTYQQHYSIPKSIGANIEFLRLHEEAGWLPDLDELQKLIVPGTKLIALTNPNNPTGTVSPTNELENFIKKVASTTIVLLDEAYTDYYDTPSMSKMIDAYPNLVIAKTFSKTFGMAGARVGYVLAHPNTIKDLNEFQAWANAGPSAVSMQGALAAIKDKEFVAYCKQENIKAKDILYQGFDALGIKHIKSFTSFVYFDTATYKKDIPALLLANQITGARSFEQNSSWLRISIGTVAEMEKVVAVLKLGA